MKRTRQQTEPTYFRLCHRCLHLNEADVEVVRCERCQKSLASTVPVRLEPDPKEGVWDEDDFDEDDSQTRRPPPLAGLSAIW